MEYLGRSTGPHQLTAIARDGSGNTTTSVAVPVTVTAPAPSGLVVALGFDEGTGATGNDTSGFGHHAALSNTAWTPSGKFGSALTFNGTTSWATIADTTTLDLTTGMTLSAWVRPTSLSGGYRTVMLKERAPGLSYGLYAADGASRPPAGYVDTGGDVSIEAAANLLADTWAHLAVTYDGTSLRLYVNGVLAGTRSATGSIRTSTAPLRIGGNAVWGEYFAGTIDEVRVYNRALTVTDIQSDLATPIGGSAPPPLPAMSIADASAAEGASGLTTMSFAVMLSTAASGPVTASYTTAGGSATPGVDFGLASGAVSFCSRGNEPDYCRLGDRRYHRRAERNVHGHVKCANRRPATLADAVATGTIVNDDVPSDTTPPSVTARMPSPGATGIAATSVVTATFSEAVAPATVTAGGFTLRAAGVLRCDGNRRRERRPRLFDAGRGACRGHHLHRYAGRNGHRPCRQWMGAPVTWSFTTAAPPPAGLVAAYAFDETTGTMRPTPRATGGPAR